jgi:glycosyltransferase involved in cell wall biosynthesis
MRIAVNAIFLQKDKLEGYGHYVQEVFSRIVQQHPDHEFIFVFDRAYDKSFIFGPNVKAIVVRPAARYALSFKIWYDITAPLALHKYKPDVWIQPYGFCSLTSKIPQVLIVHDLTFLHFPHFIPWHQRWFYQMFTKKFLHKAESIVTVSDYSKKDMVDHFKIMNEQVKVIYGAADKKFVPLSWQEKEKVKETFSGGKEYFLCTGGIHPRKNLMTLLKAFSLFKKWQHSNMKLLVVGRLAWQYEDILEKLKTYKYREDVLLLGYLPNEQLVSITAAAYAMVYPSFFEGFGLPIIEAMQCEVPVITSNTSSMPEIGGEAAMYANPNDPDDLAKQMLHIYKDEILRNRLITAGKIQAAKFNWDKAANEFWEIILSTSDNH